MGIGDHVKTVGILGCGWIGYPLAVELVRLGFDVYGSTTQAQHIDKLKNAGLKRVFQGKLQPEWSGDDIKDLCNTDLLILCFPPGKTSEENFHLKQMEALSKQIGTHTKVIYTSSTSVYPELCREVFEDDVTDLSHTAHLKIMKAEVYLKEHVGDRLIILRCGGLTGWNRNLAKFFAGKTNLQGKDVPVNLVHGKDVVHAIIHLIYQNSYGETYNVVAPLHPQKGMFYKALCTLSQLPLPEFDEKEANAPFKIVNSDKLRQTGFVFEFEDPMLFDYI